MIEAQVDGVKAVTGIDIKTVKPDAGYAKVYGAFDRCSDLAQGRAGQELRTA
ncbi:hypothetical protein NLM27_26060 [Bradyrhizobium sp. CCGB12]|uniref:hypothetical protein n=1 Tax=Bradyrhizobium sp. CCGB12 TaxID=2949632 RepID=UPI0020B30F82|nr:hypothetical protein [Bradyrhizobium sp. CCGB12]MCP3392238.1 hypothetical protein [Bradyrhizobium sp. CCGB12]